ncbi:MAG: AMIN domain-containing protein [Bdellovibrionales bacterium]|nr:AMIN domain-containing protein [Bdellovibrionales bacterium]
MDRKMWCGGFVVVRRGHRPGRRLWTVLVLLISYLLVGGTAVHADELRPISETRTRSLQYSLSGEYPDFQLRIVTAASKKAVPVEVSTVTAPSRLVVDIPDVLAPKSRVVETANDIVPRLRIGSHPDRTRLVLDFTVAETPRFQVEPDPALGATLIRFSFEDSPEHRSASTSPQLATAIDPAARAALTRVPDPMTFPVRSNAALIEDARVIAEGERHAGGLLLKIDELSQYSLKQVAPLAFRLTLSNAVFAEDSLLASIETAGRIARVDFSQQQLTVEVTLSVVPHTTLTAVQVADGLWIRAAASAREAE